MCLPEKQEKMSPEKLLGSPPGGGIVAVTGSEECYCVSSLNAGTQRRKREEEVRYVPGKKNSGGDRLEVAGKQHTRERKVSGSASLRQQQWRRGDRREPGRSRECVGGQQQVGARGTAV